MNIYDWAGGDSGSFSGWTLNGTNGGAANTGSGYCFGDGLPLGGTSSGCPCTNGGPGEGCMTSSGTGAALTASGNADVGSDTFVLNVAGAPGGKPGLFFQGSTQVNNPIGNGIMCVTSTSRYPVQFLSASGTVSASGLGANATSGASLNYQYWFRDTKNSCGGGFNFTGGWTLTWQ